MSPPDFDVQGTFRSVVEALQESGLSYAFIGALPVLAWGRVRATTDIDLVVAVGSNWERFEQALDARGIRRSRNIGPADPEDALPASSRPAPPRATRSTGRSSSAGRRPGRSPTGSNPTALGSEGRDLVDGLRGQHL